MLLKSNVINSAGPCISDCFGTRVGLSVAGPIAGAVFSLVRGGKGDLFRVLGLLICSGLEGSRP